MAPFIRGYAPTAVPADGAHQLGALIADTVALHEVLGGGGDAVVQETRLGFAAALDKPGGFIGRDAVLAQKERGPLRRRLVQVLVTDPEPLMFHAEVVRRDGRPAGYIRSASCGFTLGGAVYPAVASLRPMYDPGNKRIQS